MSSIAVLTPSYAGDLELCRDLHESVLENTDSSVVHYVVLPARDIPLFSSLRGPRTVLWPQSELLPDRFVSLPIANIHVNCRHPLPPVRGWIIQQIVKIAAASRIEADSVLVVDSDIVFVRPITAAVFRQRGSVRFYRKEEVIDAHMPRHVVWHNVARGLLGLPPADPPYPDYVSSLTAWDPRHVAAMQRRIEEIGKEPWTDILAAQLHVSEWTLYGTFVDNILGPEARAFTAAATLCHSYWDATPLDAAGAMAFLSGIQEEDIAMMISSKSRTPLDVRRAALAAWREAIGYRTSPQVEPPSMR